MNFTTTEMSNALTVLDEGAHLLIHEPDHPNYFLITLQLMNTIGTLTDQYTPDHFTDEEIDFLSNLTSMCIDIIRDAVTTHMEDLYE
jgi:hypothetical protein